MADRTHAGIELYGATLRYAEVARQGDEIRLLRLGSCDFEFDVEQAVLRSDHQARLKTLADALGDMFAGAASAHLHVALHPASCVAFFVPVDAETPVVERTEQLRQEAALLTGAPPDHTLRVTSEHVCTRTLQAEEVDWYHVLAMDEQVYARFGSIARRLPHAGYSFDLTPWGVPPLLREHLHRFPDGRSGHSLVLGWYPTHIEYTICDGADWRFSHTTVSGSPEDGAYFAVALLQRLGLAPSDVARVFFYGDSIHLDEFGVFEPVFRCVPQKLDPFLAIGMADEFSGVAVEAFAPCIGVAL